MSRPRILNLLLTRVLLAVALVTAAAIASPCTAAPTSLPDDLASLSPSIESVPCATGAELDLAPSHPDARGCRPRCRRGICGPDGCGGTCGCPSGQVCAG